MLRPALGARPKGRRDYFASTSAILIAFFLVFIGSFALTLNLRRLRESFSWVDHTDRVLLEAGTLQNDLVESTAAARTFAATGQFEALDRMTLGHAQLPRDIARLKALAVDNPAQVHRLETLDGLIAQRVDWEDREIRARQMPDVQSPLLDTAQSRQNAASIRTGLREFRSTEIALLAERQRRVTRDATITTALGAVTMLLSVLSGGLGIALLQRERQRHRLSELETELIHVSRLNTIGQTASVLAHEVNQPLTATRNYVNGARRLLRTLGEPEAAKAGEALNLAQAQVERATQIIARLRRHVQGKEPDRTAVPPTTVIEEAVLLSGIRGQPDLELKVELERGLPAIFIDPVQVQQVLINLIRNATEAMADCPRRELRIVAQHEPETLRIAVCDTGTGLAPELADRLFRPFTTTKPDGMGVGLSICRSIIEAHGGRIWAEPNAGGGTVFAFTVPLAREPSESDATASPAPNQPGRDPLHSPG